MEFYGKVIDDQSNAVVGANVTFSWDESLRRKSGKRLALQSDRAGLFSLQGARGASLVVALDKEGYYTPRPGNWIFRYAMEPRYVTDPANPTIFQLKKKGNPEPLIRLAGAMGGDRQYRLDTKGTPTEISFYTGQRSLVGEGHFRVEFWMESPQDPKQRQFQWRCRISVPGGGLLVTTDEFPFTAPVGGYAEAIEIASESKAEDWSDRVNQVYYVRLLDGKYGRAKLNVVCSENPFFGVEALVNPSGSPNLEYDKYLPGNILVNQSSP